MNNKINDKITVNLRNGSSFQIIAAPHIMRLESVSSNPNTLVFRVIKYPYKSLINTLTEQANGEIQDLQVFIYAQITRDKTYLFAEIRYGIKTWQDRRNYIVSGHVERFFNVDAEKSQIIRLIEPHLSNFYHISNKNTANNAIKYFKEWAYPPKLEDLIQDLTEDQQRQVTKYIRKIVA